MVLSMRKFTHQCWLRTPTLSFFFAPRVESDQGRQAAFDRKRDFHTSINVQLNELLLQSRSGNSTRVEWTGAHCRPHFLYSDEETIVETFPPLKVVNESMCSSTFSSLVHFTHYVNKWDCYATICWTVLVCTQNRSLKDFHALKRRITNSKINTVCSIERPQGVRLNTGNVVADIALLLMNKVENCYYDIFDQVCGQS